MNANIIGKTSKFTHSHKLECSQHLPFWIHLIESAPCRSFLEIKSKENLRRTLLSRKYQVCRVRHNLGTNGRTCLLAKASYYRSLANR